MPKFLCWGMTSRIPDTEENVVFLDYDYTAIPQITEIIARLQDKYGLGSAYMAESGPERHHVVFLDRLPLDVWERVIQESQCHDGYRFHLGSQSYGILRLIKKGANPAPRWVGSVWGKSKWKQSTVHGLILTKFWGILKGNLLIENPDRGDGEDSVWESVYYFSDNSRELMVNH